MPQDHFRFRDLGSRIPKDFGYFMMFPYQTCSMSWGVLSLNVNSGKTWWSTVLLWVLRLIAPCPCYNALHVLIPMKIGKKSLGSWIQGSAGFAGSWAFFSKFWYGKKQNSIGMWKGNIYAISYNRNKWCIALILVRIWNQWKRWLVSWHMSVPILASINEKHRAGVKRHLHTECPKMLYRVSWCCKHRSV